MFLFLRLQHAQQLVACFSLKFRGGKLEWQAKNTNRSSEQHLPVPFNLLKDVLQQKDDCYHTIKGDAWFGSVKVAAALGQKGMRAVLQVKNNKALYPKEDIEKALENAPGGVHIVLKGNAPNGVELIAIGYWHSTKTTLFFVATAYAGSMRPGKEYVMKVY